MYTIFYAKEAAKDAKKLKAAFLDQKAKALIDILRANPYQRPPAYEKLQGDLAGLYSRRINRKHRLVYAVEEKKPSNQDFVALVALRARSGRREKGSGNRLIGLERKKPVEAGCHFTILHSTSRDSCRRAGAVSEARKPFGTFEFGRLDSEA